MLGIMLGKAYSVFIVWLNLFAATSVLFYPGVSVGYCAAAAVCIMAALFIVKDFSYAPSDNSEVEELKIKLSVMTQERDECISHLDHLARKSITL